jgi:tetraprenyl-beta-curcumene synthase
MWLCASLQGQSAPRTDALGISRKPPNPAPLSARQLWVLVSAAVRELLWGLPAVAREVRVWRIRAQAIPDATIRADAVSALVNKRTHTDGAALFWILPRARSLPLLRLLAAFEIMCDFLDCVSERGAHRGQENGKQLHLALVDALVPGAPSTDYYLLHPWRQDGGYLRALVEICRESCRLLPGYEYVRELVLQEARRAQVLAINHDLEPARRDADLREWAEREGAGAYDVAWFEFTGAASAPLTIHALLALSVEPAPCALEIARVHGAYLPWISAATTMLDSYVDQIEDAANGDHSYVSHYCSRKDATRRICRLLCHSLVEVGGCHRAEQHILIVACMAAMYLSKDSAYSDTLRADTAVLVRAGGSLTRMLLPVLRLWRIAYAQKSS